MLDQIARFACVALWLWGIACQVSAQSWPSLPVVDSPVELPGQEWPHRKGDRTIRVLVHYPQGTLDSVNPQTGVMLSLHNWGGENCVGTADPKQLATRLNVISLCVNYLQSGRQASILDPEPYDFGYLQGMDAIRALWFVCSSLEQLRKPFDDARIFGTGGSGGGNVALMANKLAPRTFACIIDMCGMNKLSHDVAFNLPGSSPLNARWSRNPVDHNFLSMDDQEIRFVGNLPHLHIMKRLDSHCKVIVVHGVEDSTCPVADAREMVDNFHEAKLDIEARWITPKDLDGKTFTSAGHALGNRTEIVFQVAAQYLLNGTSSSLRRIGRPDWHYRDEVVYPTSNGRFVVSYRDGFPVGRFEREPIAPSYRDHQDLTYWIDSVGREQPLKTAEDWSQRRAHVLKNMQSVMGRLPGATMRVPLAAKTIEESQRAGILFRKIEFQSDPENRLRAWILIPIDSTIRQLRDSQSGRLPAVLCLHQTTAAGKDEVVGIAGAPTMHYALELARRGYVTMSPDYPSLGENKIDFAAVGIVAPSVFPEPVGTVPNSLAYQSGTMKAIWDNMRAIDFLETVNEVDPQRIGVIGHSLGGHNAIFTAAFEPRLRVVVSSCGFSSMSKDDLPSWTGPRYMPRIQSVFHSSIRELPFDFHEIVACLAPRPFLAVAARQDSDFDIDGVVDVMAASKHVYGILGYSDNLQSDYPDCPHDFPQQSRAKAYDFLDLHLTAKGS